MKWIIQRTIWTDSQELFKHTNAIVICYNYHVWWIQSHHKSNKHRCTQTDQHVVWMFLEHTFGSVCFLEINVPWIDSLPLCSLSGPNYRIIVDVRVFTNSIFIMMFWWILSRSTAVTTQSFGGPGSGFTEVFELNRFILLCLCGAGCNA